MLSNCVVHRRGRVTIDGCRLHCLAWGLEHLFSPLVTVAACTGLADAQQSMAQRSVGVASRVGQGCSTVPGDGVLQVVETKILVSCSAVGAGMLYTSGGACNAQAAHNPACARTA